MSECYCILEPNSYDLNNQALGAAFIGAFFFLFLSEAPSRTVYSVGNRGERGGTSGVGDLFALTTHRMRWFCPPTAPSPPILDRSRAGTKPSRKHLSRALLLSLYVREQMAYTSISRQQSFEPPTFTPTSSARSQPFLWPLSWSDGATRSCQQSFKPHKERSSSIGHHSHCQEFRPSYALPASPPPLPPPQRIHA